MTDHLRETGSREPIVLTVAAPAKVNLILRVLDRRPDGFHNVWSLMQTVGLEDLLTIRVSHEHAEIRLTCDDASLSVGPSNLVFRAADAVRREGGLSCGVEIHLAKRIPMGAGLGGGSSDAAATIQGLNQVLHLGWTPARMAEVGQQLGSDVPFFLYGPAAIVSGRGEVVRPLRLEGSRWVVLVNPGFPVDTKWAYHQLSSTRKTVEPLSESLGRLIAGKQASWNDVVEWAVNDFEAPVFTAHPVLADVKEELLAEGAEMALLSGSGATVFGVFGDEPGASKAAACFQGRSNLKVFAVPAVRG